MSESAGVEVCNDEEEELPESREFQVLRATIETVVRKVVNSVSSQMVIDIVRSNNKNKCLTKREEQSLYRRHSKLQKLLEEIIKKDIDDYIGTSGILQAHEAISKLSSGNSTSPALSWRPTGDPSQDMRSHEVENEMKFNLLLQEMVKEKEAEIQCLKQQISHKRFVVENLTRNLLVLKKDFFRIYCCESAMPKHFEDMIRVLSKENS